MANKISSKKPLKLFHVYKFLFGDWVHSSYIQGRSWEAVIKANPQYANKSQYTVVEAR